MIGLTIEIDIGAFTFRSYVGKMKVILRNVSVFSEVLTMILEAFSTGSGL